MAITVTLKGSADYNAPWVSVEGDEGNIRPTLEGIAQLGHGADLSLGELVAQAARQFRTDYAVASQLGAKPADPDDKPQPAAAQQHELAASGTSNLDKLSLLQRDLDDAHNTADLASVYRKHKKLIMDDENAKAMLGEAQRRIKGK